MANLAIRGHKTRGKEVIELLEMLGGNNSVYDLDGSDENAYYYIHHGYIDADHKDMIGEPHPEFKHYTLEEFLEKFPYKVGDKVLLEGEVKTIKQVCWNNTENEVIYKLETNVRGFSEEYYVHHYDLRPYKEETMEIPEKLMPKIDFNEYCKDKYILDLGNYEIKEENGKTYAVRKRFEYPKTYEECCDVLKIEYPFFKTEEDGISASTYKNKLFGALKQLLICRDAYWKIAGEQLGLGKPWEPDWENVYENHYTIVVYEHILKTGFNEYSNRIFMFPTEEMRNAFYENFKDLISKCKELL